jgi:hypothetical protein
MERTEIEPVTSGLQNRQSDGVLRRDDARYAVSAGTKIPQTEGSTENE